MTNTETRNPTFGDRGYILPSRIVEDFGIQKLQNLEDRMSRSAKNAVGADFAVKKGNSTFRGKIVKVEVQDIRIRRCSILGRYRVTIESQPPYAVSRKSFCITRLPR